jgi:hypothetical protein
MASPFGDFHNGILKIPSQASSVTLNATTGNYESNATLIDYKVYLKPSRPTVTPKEGLDASSVFLSGYLVDPMSFPQGFEFPNRITATVDLATGTQTGSLELGIAIASAFGVEAITGTKIYGWFQVQGEA